MQSQWEFRETSINQSSDVQRQTQQASTVVESTFRDTRKLLQLSTTHVGTDLSRNVQVELNNENVYESAENALKILLGVSFMAQR